MGYRLHHASAAAGPGHPHACRGPRVRSRRWH
jgi:hypothetical protein